MWTEQINQITKSSGAKLFYVYFFRLFIPPSSLMLWDNSPKDILGYRLCFHSMWRARIEILFFCWQYSFDRNSIDDHNRLHFLSFQVFLRSKKCEFIDFNSDDKNLRHKMYAQLVWTNKKVLSKNVIKSFSHELESTAERHKRTCKPKEKLEWRRTPEQRTSKWTQSVSANVLSVRKKTEVQLC